MWSSTVGVSARREIGRFTRKSVRNSEVELVEGGVSVARF